MSDTAWGIAALTLGLPTAALAVRWLWRFGGRVRGEKAAELFRLQRERLESRFEEMARSATVARGHYWHQCRFDGRVRFARLRRGGQLAALAAMTVRMVQRETADRPDAAGRQREAVSRHGTAIFHYRHGHWGCDGHMLLDLTPAEALAELSARYRPLFPDETDDRDAGEPCEPDFL